MGSEITVLVASKETKNTIVGTLEKGPQLQPMAALKMAQGNQLANNTQTWLG